jgi:hypothetical protein
MHVQQFCSFALLPGVLLKVLDFSLHILPQSSWWLDWQRSLASKSMDVFGSLCNRAGGRIAGSTMAFPGMALIASLPSLAFSRPIGNFEDKG